MSPAHRRALGLAIALLAAGFFFRAWAVGHARFTGDESYFWATARNVATFQAAPIYGPSMTGSGANHPGPIFYYLMALPQRLGPSPWWGGLFVALLHTLSSALLGLLAYRARGERAGLVALALVAFAPWDVLYGDRIWLSCVAPVWGAIILYAATRLDDPRMQGVLVFFALTCPQLHMSAPIVWASALVLAWATPRPARPDGAARLVVSKKAVAIAVVLVLLAYAAPIYNELRTSFSNTRAILSEGGGKEPWDVVAVTPLKVLGYAVLSATSEIGYHFETGYWRPFKESEAYFSARGMAAWWGRHGALWGSLTLLTVLVSVIAWVAGWVRLARAIRARKTAPLPLDAGVMLALTVGLLAAMALMMGSKKGFFPHYTNLLMPLMVWPVVVLIDAALDRARAIAARGLGAVVLALTMLAMASASARYYLEIDRRNGLDATAAMVETVMTGPQPVEVHFDGFYNRFAWEMLANTGYKRGLPLGSPPAVRYQVRNGRVHDGAQPLPERATLQDGVVMEVR